MRLRDRGGRRGWRRFETWRWRIGHDERVGDILLSVVRHVPRVNDAVIRSRTDLD